MPSAEILPKPLSHSNDVVVFEQMCTFTCSPQRVHEPTNIIILDYKHDLIVDTRYCS